MVALRGGHGCVVLFFCATFSMQIWLSGVEFKLRSSKQKTVFPFPENASVTQDNQDNPQAAL